MQYYRHNGAALLPVILETVRLMDSLLMMAACGSLFYDVAANCLHSVESCCYLVFFCFTKLLR